MLRKPFKQNGFTYLELVMVIIILSILGAVALARWPSPQINLSAQAQQVASDIRYTQSLAMSQGQRYRINFTSTSTYTITTTSGTVVTNIITGANNTALNTGMTFTLPPTNLPNNLVAFDGKGIPYTNSSATTALASSAVITLNSQGQTKTITITPGTGRVSVS